MAIPNAKPPLFLLFPYSSFNSLTMFELDWDLVVDAELIGL